MTLPIETPRLRLRRFVTADVADVANFASDPLVAAATPDFEATEAGVQAYINRQNSYRPFEQGQCFDLAIELRAESRVIGLLSLVHKSSHIAEVGYALGPAYRGRGLASEATGALVDYAFETLGVHRVQAETEAANEASWRLMERLGMKREACLRQAVERNGDWQDLLIYGILADEWRFSTGSVG